MNIDGFAPCYRWVEYLAFGRALERARFRWLHRLADARRLLVLGEGDGRALERLLALAPHAQIDVVETSAAMIALARNRAGNPDRVRFHQQNALTATWPSTCYDGVITLFFLDCFLEGELRLLMHRLAAALVPGGLWIVSDFAIPEHGWRHWNARIWISSMYRFFRLTTGLEVRALPPIEELLVDAGLLRVELEEERAGLIRAQVWRSTPTILLRRSAGDRAR
jgi:SAM-dependent methyltransferase